MGEDNLTYSLLMIEDRLSECTLLSTALRKNLKEPLEILWCRSYEEAFGPLFSKKWDLVLINAHLNGDEGLPTLKKVKNITEEKNTPTVMYYSEKSDSWILEKAIKAGASAVLTTQDIILPEGSGLLLSTMTEN